MSDTNKNNGKRLDADAIEARVSLYRGVGTGNGRLGSEIELAFFNPVSPDLAFMTREQNKAVRDAAENIYRLATSVEATSETLEVATDAFTFTNVGRVIEDASCRIRKLTAAAGHCGLKRSWTEYLPQSSFSDLKKQVMDRPRSTAFIEAFHRHGAAGIANYFTASKATQVSVSHEDPEHLLRNVRRLYFLAPYLFLLTENSCRFTENDPKAVPFHPGMHYRAQLGQRGFIADYIFSAQTGEELIRAHLNEVVSTPMFTWIGQDGEFVQAAPGGLKSFRDLAGEGLNTQANFELAESMLWHDVKIAGLRDADNNVQGYRYEARMFGVGAHQHATAPLIVGALAFDDDFASKTDALLLEHGFDVARPWRSRDILLSAYKNALTRGGDFMNIDYGLRPMIDFSRRFGALLSDCYAGRGLDVHLRPLLHIAETGRTDGRVNAETFYALKDVKNFQRHYRSFVLDQPAVCADMLIRGEMNAIAAAMKRGSVPRWTP